MVVHLALFEPISDWLVAGPVNYCKPEAIIDVLNVDCAFAPSVGVLALSGGGPTKYARWQYMCLEVKMWRFLLSGTSFLLSMASTAYQFHVTA